MSNKIDVKIISSWVKAFQNTPFIKGDVFQETVAYQFYYGIDAESFPAGYPSGLPFNFRQITQSYIQNQQVHDVDTLCGFLLAIGIKLNKNHAASFIKTQEQGYFRLIKNIDNLLRILAHRKTVNRNFPFYGCDSELFLLTQIENNTSQFSFFFEDDSPVEFYKRNFELPEDYPREVFLRTLFHEIESTKNNYFITGKAGTGKSTFINYICRTSSKKITALAYTGIAAMNIGGNTIHSVFKFPTQPLLPGDPEIKKLYGVSLKIIEETDIFIIDEVSMLRSDILEAIDFSLRINTGNSLMPFGGKQIILVGDIFQLPPIVNTSDDIEQQLFSLDYKSRYFFDAPAFDALNPRMVEFKTVYRQESDMEFVNLLNHVRECTIDSAGIAKLNTRLNPDFSPSRDDFMIMLTTVNSVAERENDQKLAALPDSSFYFNAEIAGEFPQNRYPTLQRLELKKNAQVVMVKNDSLSNGRRWVNGSIAKVTLLSDDFIELKFNNGATHTIYKEIWEYRKLEWDQTKRALNSKVVGTFRQFPLKLAWAITIHKSQGLTFEGVLLDLAYGTFENGQLYTALSRCRTLEGLILRRAIRPQDIITDERILAFHKANFSE